MAQHFRPSTPHAQFPPAFPAAFFSPEIIIQKARAKTKRANSRVMNGQRQIGTGAKIFELQRETKFVSCKMEQSVPSTHSRGALWVAER